MKRDKGEVLLLLAIGVTALVVAWAIAQPPSAPVSSPGVPSPSVSPAQSEAQRVLISPDVSVGTPLPSPTGEIGDPAFYFKPTPKPKVAPSVRGIASWYDYVPGGAAAGPGLRRFLGAHWRGTRVRVCASSGCVDVVLSDFCRCDTGAVKLIDLDVRSFAALRDPSRGTMMVTVTPLR